MVKIEEERCIGCGVCQSICPDGFEVINGKSVVKDENAGCVKEAVKACPRNAILIEDPPNDNSEGHSGTITIHRDNSFGNGMHRGEGKRGRGKRGRGMHLGKDNPGGGMHRGRRF